MSQSKLSSLIQDTFNQELPADPRRDNSPRQVLGACFSYVKPRIPTAPQLVHRSPAMLAELGISAMDEQHFLEIFSGTRLLANSESYAMCYGGHQFGSWAGQLGDGRAINLAEIVHHQKRWALQLKGAGLTPYSRSADGLAVLRSSIREHLCSEAMHHLGVPTTRSLSLMLTGDEVLRDVLYNGNPAYEKGAVVCRVAPSFIRFGNFQIFAARNELDILRQLADYSIRHFFFDIEPGSQEAYIQFFRAVASRTLEMIVHWQRVGFVHGVMNTDNLSILGLTIDYGPYGWLEGYDPDWTPNTTDKDYRRYRFANQPGVALWNLAQLANALYPLVKAAEPFEAILQEFNDEFERKYLDMMRQKLGLAKAEKADAALVKELTELLPLSETDMTIFFRRLAEVNRQSELLDCVRDAFYRPEEIRGEIGNAWQKWAANYLARLDREDSSAGERRTQMNAVNPKYVLRNYMAQLAIDQADQGDYALIEELYQLLKKPYEEQPEQEKWFAKRPEWARHKVGCSMLSCSS